MAEHIYKQTDLFKAPPKTAAQRQATRRAKQKKTERDLDVLLSSLTQIISKTERAKARGNDDGVYKDAVWEIVGTVSNYKRTT
jgi:hypothetical protein